MYFGNPNAKLYNLYYKGKFYNSGTKFIFDGKCLLDGQEEVLDNKVCEYLYTEGLFRHFKYNDKIYTCRWEDFDWRIKGIVENDIQQPIVQGNTTQQTTEIYWTNDMVAKTIWYILIMLVAFIFNERVGIWILATIVWYVSTFKK